MSLNPEYFVRVFILVFIIVISTVFFGVYQQVLFVKKQRRDLLYNFRDDISDNDTYTEYVDLKYAEKRQTMQYILNVKKQIKNINMRQTVYNTELGPVNNQTHIIVIQVHSNVFYLQELLSSLRVANGIHKALLIFSHDYFSYKINELIKTVNFAKYMQIFFPYSIQLHPNVYPGQDGQLCSEGYVCKQSNLRDPKSAQTKHHWWWLANQVFDNLEITKAFDTTFLFLEEGDYVTEDFLYVYKLLKQSRYLHCPFCELLSIGARDPEITHYNKNTLITVEVWTNLMHRSGIAFNRRIWTALKNNREEFCYYNDYNWDNSMRHVAIRKWEGNIYMTAISGTRVFHLEKCDDKEDEGCKMEYKVEEVKKYIKIISKNLFPWSIVMVIKKEEDFNGTALGLWEDIRDRDLCMYFTDHNVWY